MLGFDLMTKIYAVGFDWMIKYYQRVLIPKKPAIQWTKKIHLTETKKDSTDGDKKDLTTIFTALQHRKVTSARVLVLVLQTK